MQWDGASWNQTQPFPVGQTEYAKVAPVKGEHHVNPFTVCQVYQRCIGKLYPQAFILGEDRGNPREIRLAQSDKLKGAAMERGQEFPNRQGVCTQEPCRFGNHGPTSQQRPAHPPKLLDTRFMVFVGFQQDGHDRPGIHQNLAGQESPNPSKYFGFVLRSRAVPFTAPINPAFFASSYAVSEPSSAASCRSTAPRTRSLSPVPARRAEALSRRRSSGENRTVMR
jgi:hypothetical protein